MTVVFDIETKLVYNQQVPRYLGYLHEDALGIVDSPDCVEQLVEIFKDGDYYEYSFYAHNFSGFDSYFITPALLKKKGTIVKMFVKNNKIMFIKCYFESTTFYFRDTFLYTNLPLLEIYKMIGWKKKFLTNFSRKNLYSYLAFDLVGLYYVLL